jgi:hypothetical protein
VWLRGTVGSDAYAAQLSQKMWKTSMVWRRRRSSFFPQEDPKTGKVAPLTSAQVLQNQWSVRDLKKVGTGGDQNAGIPVAVWQWTKAKAKADGWTAQMLPEHVFATKEEMAARTNGYIPPTAEELAAFTKPGPMTDELEQTPTIPDTFDGRSEFEGCVALKIVSQGGCGSCWAFAFAKAYSTGLCHFSQKRVNINLSEEDLVNCAVDAPGSWSAKSSIAAERQDYEGGLDYANGRPRFNGCNGGWAIDGAAAMSANGGLRARECSEYTYGNDASYTAKNLQQGETLSPASTQHWTADRCKAASSCSAGGGGYDYNIIPPGATSPPFYRYSGVAGMQTGFILFGNQPLPAARSSQAPSSPPSMSPSFLTGPFDRSAFYGVAFWIGVRVLRGCFQ